MDTKDLHVIAILGDQKRFVVPIYQRQYSWQEQRLAPFWDDVVAKAEQALEGRARFSHYMGALIIAPGTDGYTIGSTPRVQVVDGQQRLRTRFRTLYTLERYAPDRHAGRLEPSNLGHQPSPLTPTHARKGEL